MRFRNLMVTAVTLAIASCGTFAAAATIVFDDFDGYADQAAFQAVWTPIGSDGTAPSGLLSTDQSVSSPNSVHVPGTGVNNQYRNQQVFTATSAEAGNPLVFSFDYYDSNAAASPYRQFANLQAPIGPTASLISMGLNNNLTSAAEGGNFYMARILGINAGAYFKLNEGGDDTLRSTGWHNLAVHINDTEFNFYVDGILAKTLENITALQSYTSITLGSGLSNAENAAYFDNVRLAIIPEPSTFALAGLALAGLAFAARRRVG